MRDKGRLRITDYSAPAWPAHLLGQDCFHGAFRLMPTDAPGAGAAVVDEVPAVVAAVVDGGGL